MFNQIFLSPQVKRCAIITYKHGIHELPNESPNDLGNVRKVSKLHKMITQCPAPRQNQYFANTTKKTLGKQKLNLSRKAQTPTKIRANPKYPANDPHTQPSRHTPADPKSIEPDAQTPA